MSGLGMYVSLPYKITLRHFSYNGIILKLIWKQKVLPLSSEPTLFEKFYTMQHMRRSLVKCNQNSSQTHNPLNLINIRYLQNIDFNGCTHNVLNEF